MGTEVSREPRSARSSAAHAAHVEYRLSQAELFVASRPPARAAFALGAARKQYNALGYLWIQRKQLRARSVHLRRAETDELSGGERGIRTLDTGLSPYNALAGRPLRPLGHLSEVRGILHALGDEQAA